MWTCAQTHSITVQIRGVHSRTSHPRFDLVILGLRFRDGDQRLLLFREESNLVADDLRNGLDVRHCQLVVIAVVNVEEKVVRLRLLFDDEDLQSRV